MLIKEVQKLSLQQAIVSAIAISDIHNLSLIYTSVNSKSQPEISISSTTDENWNAAKLGGEFAKEDKSGLVLLTADEWDKNKGKLIKLFSDKTIESVDSWLSIQMLNGVESLTVRIIRTHTVLGAKSDYIIMPSVSVIDSDYLSRDRSIFFDKADHYEFNEAFDTSAYFHGAINSLYKKLSDSFFKPSNEITAPAIKKCIPDVTANDFLISVGDFKYKLQVRHSKPQIRSDLNSIALLSDGYFVGKVDAPTAMQLLSDDLEDKQPLSKRQESEVITEINTKGSEIAISVDGRSFAFGSF
ncbi:hypothetical protein [Providencia sp. PROV089]|uniref:hypothetical protein n=1 Tax=Providencia sp. PROV089 TaxID=2949805 RepID=UPI002349D4BD|nr:hypothetical protein [Providencia sp. PROV089]